ncbi:MAG: type 4a pilus biogenesis protein PilO [Myxococcales bacterium]|nr:type 4a pilus biogenesis protein PilO [Myxococcales bacterium]
MGDFLDQFNKIPLVQKVFMLLLILGAVMFAFFMLVLSPIEEETKQKQDRQTELQGELARVRNLERDLVTVNARLSEAEALSSTTEGMIPNELNEASLIRELNEAVWDVPDDGGVGFALRGLSRGSPGRQRDLRWLPVELSVTGSYRQVITLIWELASMDRLIHVRGVTMSPKRSLVQDFETSSDGVFRRRLNATIQLRAFYRPG